MIEQKRGRQGRWHKDADRVCQRCGHPETEENLFAPKRFLHAPCLQAYNREKQREHRRDINGR